ncbi:unnamed protein product [Phytophthora lilii]|uniref:Unnamed protein product n=1 Tax=Phytophthora lilii TaxID=2077276 RepID=A0A9W6WQT6_9STRA|nr:unnamed protein product [Phytophthora lilii]
MLWKTRVDLYVGPRSIISTHIAHIDTHIGRACAIHAVATGVAEASSSTKLSRRSLAVASGAAAVRSGAAAADLAPSRFFRSPSDAPRMTPQEMIANEVATEITPVERAMVLSAAVDPVVPTAATEDAHGLLSSTNTKAGPITEEDVLTRDTISDNTAVRNGKPTNADPVLEKFTTQDILAAEVNAVADRTAGEDVKEEDNKAQDIPAENIVIENTPVEIEEPVEDTAQHDDAVDGNIAQDDHLEDDSPTDEDIHFPPVISVLHANTPEQLPLNVDIPFSIQTSSQPFDEYEELFPQHGKSEPGRHYRVKNLRLLTQLGSRERDSVLIICVFNNAESWGNNRNATDFFNLVGSFEYPTDKISIALLTSSMDEFAKARTLFGQHTHFLVSTHKTIHNCRRGTSTFCGWTPTLTSFHQVSCSRWYSPAVISSNRSASVTDREEPFVPGPLNAKNLHKLGGELNDFVPLDSVGGTMLYVRADVHRQGVVFPMHYIIGSEWDEEGYDGIETEGLCYTAHFLGFKCWGLPNDAIFHAT